MHAHTAWRAGAPRERKGDVLAQGFCRHSLLSPFNRQRSRGTKRWRSLLETVHGIRAKTDRLFPELFPGGQDALEKCGLPRRLPGTQRPTAPPPEAEGALSQEPHAPDLSLLLGRLGQLSFLAPWALPECGDCLLVSIVTVTRGVSRIRAGMLHQALQVCTCPGNPWDGRS